MVNKHTDLHMSRQLIVRNSHRLAKTFLYNLVRKQRIFQNFKSLTSCCFKALLSEPGNELSSVLFFDCEENSKQIEYVQSLKEHFIILPRIALRNEDLSLLLQEMILGIRTNSQIFEQKTFHICKVCSGFLQSGLQGFNHQKRGSD